MNEIHQKLFLLRMLDYNESIPEHLINSVLEIQAYVQHELDESTASYKIVKLHHEESLQRRDVAV